MQWLKKILGAEKPALVPDRVTFKRVSSDLYELRITGVLSKSVVDKVQAMAAREIEQGSKNLRMLLVLDGFGGWRRGDNWGDLDFFMQYGDAIARIAVVGDLKWKEEVFGFILVGNRRGEVRYFTPVQESQARAWLA